MSVETKEYISRLYSLQYLGIKMGLDNIRNFLKMLGNPEKKLKVFHIAGSNGKGSVSSFIASILQEAGNSVGLYTSPHFVRFNERIRVNGLEIPDHYIESFMAKHGDYLHEQKITFFEATTALAFEYFAVQDVDYVVLETGLGGRLDATNVVHPLASVITSISLEHTSILGDTIPKIATEKAGIIKPDTKVFTGKLPDEAFAVIESSCNEKKCELFPVEDYIIEREKTIELYTEEIDMFRLESPLKGKFQRYNAALAVLTVYETLDIVDEQIFKNGLNKVLENTGIQGRFEQISDYPMVILDSAHNPEGVAVFMKEFKSYVPALMRKSLLFTGLKDKNLREMIKQTAGVYEEYYYTELAGNERAATRDELSALFTEAGITAVFVENAGRFVNEFIDNRGNNDCLAVMGSMYLLGEVKNRLQSIRMTKEQP